MNLLIDELPESVRIGNREYEICSNFRTFILYELLWQDDSLELAEKVKKSLLLCYPEIPGDYKQAAKALLWFYKCGKEPTPQKQAMAARKEKAKVYSFDYDDDYIYAAFMSQYGIDLQDIEYLHWWKFRALFNSLTSENEFVKIMEYRSINLNDIPKGQRAFYRRMKNIHALPVPKDEEEKQNAIEKALMNGGDLTGLI